MASTRRTYDTDSIVLRRIFAYNPADNLPFSTGYILASLTKGSCTFQNPIEILSSFGYESPGGISSLVSTLNADILSVITFFSPYVPSSQQIFLPSTVEGLGTYGYISTPSLTSTTIGLGSLGYISSGITFDALQSTTAGLGTIGYLSSSQLFSTIENLGTTGFVSTLSLQSTVEGLGTVGYISTIENLGSLGFVSTPSLVSTVEGLGTFGYISSTQLTSTVNSKTIYRSTYAIDPFYLPPNSCNIGYLYNNIFVNQAIQSIYTFPIGELASKITNQSKLDVEFEPNIQYTYFNPVSGYFSLDTFFSLADVPVSPDVFIGNPSTLGYQRYQYYILNESAINIANMFTNKYRFIVQPNQIIDGLFNVSTVFRLYHQFPNVPSTNQFYFYPTSTSAVTVIVDNTPAN
jgi:hypothetical protein